MSERLDDSAFGFAARVSLYFGCIFSVFGVMQPYLNAWFVHRGLSLSDVAFIATVTPLMRMTATPVVSFLADRWQAHWRIMVVSGWLYLGAWLMMASVHGLWPLLLAQLLVAASGAGLIPLLDALAINGVKARGLDYGRMRLWGSITFIAGSVVAGVLVDCFGMGLAIWLIIAGATATAIAGHLLPRPPAVARSKPLSLADAGGLLRSPVFLLFLIGGGALSAAHMLLYIYSVLHWQTQGLSNAWAGVLWGIGVVAEITLFAFAGSWLRGRSPVHVMLIGAVAAVVRWTAMAFDPPLALLIPLQALHGLTFGALHLGAILFMTRAVPEAQAGTGQGLYGVFTAGIGGTLGAWIAGMGYAASGGLAYLWMSALALAGLVALIAVARRWDGSAIAVK